MFLLTQLIGFFVVKTYNNGLILPYGMEPPEEVKENLEKRDRIDSGREISPLKKADDAIEFDNSEFTPEQDYEFLHKKIDEVLNK